MYDLKATIMTAFLERSFQAIYYIINIVCLEHSAGLVGDAKYIFDEMVFNQSQAIPFCIAEFPKDEWTSNCLVGEHGCNTLLVCLCIRILCTLCNVQI